MLQHNFPHIVSIALHAGLASLVFIYQPLMNPMDKGDGLFIELQDGPTTKGETILPPVVKVEEKQKKKPIKKVKKPIVKKTSPVVTPQQTESAKVVTQTQESPIKASQELAQIEASAPSEEASLKFGTNNGIRDARFLQQQKGNKPPSYPVHDRLRKRQGQVVVLGFINDEGYVQRIKLESTSGSKEMNYNALKAFSLYRFEKGQQGWVRMPFQFTLKGPPKRIHGRHRTDNTRVR